jgi:Protein of unknown function (DUF1236)
MRTVLLTTVAAAALGAVALQAGAQDNAPSRNKAPAGGQSSGVPEAQQKGAEPESGGKSRAAPTRSEESGGGQQRMGQEGAARHKLKGGTAGEEAKPEPGSVTPPSPSEKRNAEESATHKPSSGKQPTTTQGKAGEENAPRTRAGKAQKGTVGGTKAAPNAVQPDPAGSTESQNKAKENGPGAAANTAAEQAPRQKENPGTRTGRSVIDHEAEQTPGKAVTLNSRQQTEIRSALAGERVESIDRVDFSVATGTVLPEHVSIHPLPERIVEIVPQYRGYDFIMVRQEIVIIEPRTRRIVTVLHGEGRSAVNAPRGQLHLTSKQRHLIRQNLTRNRSAAHADVQPGERVPDDISLMDMPEAIVGEVPIIRPYSYFETDEDVVLVDPGTREIVEIIR